MKYLGLHLDGRWCFEEHFARLAPRVGGVAASLSRLLPNLGGPDGRVRRLYVGTVASVVLYEAPIWADAASRSPRIRRMLSGAHRPIVLRAARAYRTVAYAAAAVIAGSSPLELLAQGQAVMYWRIRELRGRGMMVGPTAKEAFRRQVADSVLVDWQRQLAGPVYEDQRVVRAVLPVLGGWLSRAWGQITFRVAQVMTGHGCFGHYLCRIGREPTPRCHHCEGDRDTAQHTLEACPAWEVQRRALVAVVGGDLSLAAVV